MRERESAYYDDPGFPTEIGDGEGEEEEYTPLRIVNMVHCVYILTAPGKRIIVWLHLAVLPILSRG